MATSDLRQYFFCPRIVYWRRVFRASYRPGKVVEVGGDKAYWLSRLNQFKGCDVEFDVRLRSKRLGLVGVLDALVKCRQRAYPVEVKRGVVKDGHDVQLGAYAMMLEELGYEVSEGYLYYPGRGLVRVEVNEGLRKKVIRTVEEVRGIICQGKMPKPTRERWKCIVCDHETICRGV